MELRKRLQPGGVAHPSHLLGWQLRTGRNLPAAALVWPLILVAALASSCATPSRLPSTVNGDAEVNQVAGARPAGSEGQPAAFDQVSVDSVRVAPTSFEPVSNGSQKALPVLRVGTSGDYAPFTTVDQGVRRGFDIDVARAFAQSQGYALRWVEFRWPQLSEAVRKGHFDVAMSGVTWQPERATIGYFTRAVASGGPCVLGDASGAIIAVNHGGVLERWARRQYSKERLRVVDDNLTLPRLLEDGEVDAVVTDTFELVSFNRTAQAASCEPAVWRKAYWVAPSRASELGSRLDHWLQSNASFVAERTRHWLGVGHIATPNAHLVDLLARRLAYMPLVAAYKRQHGLPIEDREREATVLQAALVRAKTTGISESALRSFFALQIELAKAVQRRSRAGESLDLTTQIRPALIELGDRIVEALDGARRSGAASSCTASDLAPLSQWLRTKEIERLVQVLRAIGVDE